MRARPHLSVLLASLHECFSAPAEAAQDKDSAERVANPTALSHAAVSLHDPESGRLNAKRVATLFGLSLRETASLLGQKPQAVSKTPDAPSLQPALAAFERIAALLASLV